MRVLLCLDGSARAELATELVANIDWPTDSTIRLVTVVSTPQTFFSTPWAPAAGGSAAQLEAELSVHGESLLEEGARRLAGSGRSLERVVLHGRPASVILEHARKWPADLVVVGSRGHGPIATMLLGSVSAEVVEHAGCPVLVARQPRLNRLVLAHDGSSDARRAEELLSAWPIFERVAVEVISVAPGGAAWRSNLAPGIAAELEDHGRLAEAALDEYRLIADQAAARLRSAGLRATSLVGQGDPAEGIIAAAEGSQADLIVTGSHGRTGVTRVLLGSVARNVTLHAGCSVLVARGPNPNGAG